MEGQEDDSDKTLEATQHKLDEARKKGCFHLFGIKNC